MEAAASGPSSSRPRPLVRALPEDAKSMIRSGVRIPSVTQAALELVHNAVDAGANDILVSVNLNSFKIQGSYSIEKNVELVLSASKFQAKNPLVFQANFFFSFELGSRSRTTVAESRRAPWGPSRRGTPPTTAAARPTTCSHRSETRRGRTGFAERHCPVFVRSQGKLKTCHG